MITETFSPFYDFARRKLGLSPKLVKTYLNEQGTASLTGRVVFLRFHDEVTNSDQVTLGRAGLGHTAHATRWVNEFNKRAANR